MAQQPTRAKAYCANSVYATLVPEVHEQIYRSGGQSDRRRADPRATEEPYSKTPGVDHVLPPAPFPSQAKLIILIFL
ncbi:hypothetical protein TNCV_1057141 [Trichonephila clavipes]|nr:hypothetical protein TNCV_1057141 [Trichonephila clavipes]